MTEEHAPRASQAPQSPRGPSRVSESRPASSRPPQDDSAPREECTALGCHRPRGRRRVVLITPAGRDGAVFGPWCDEETDRLIKDLIPRYTDGSPTYRIEETPDA